MTLVIKIKKIDLILSYNHSFYIESIVFEITEMQEAQKKEESLPNN